MACKYIVRLSVEERAQLERKVATGKSTAAVLMHARILLKADTSHQDGKWDDGRIAEALETSQSTAYRVRKEFVEEGLETALYRKRPTGRQYRMLDGAGEAQLIALACSKAPKGRVRWTMELLADKMIKLKIVDSISDTTVYRTLEKNKLKPWLQEQWVLPPKANAAFVAAMEDVLEVYTRPYDPKHPQVCLDEASKQLVAEVQIPLPMEPGQPERIDYEYERCGTANLFMVFEPLAGRRRVTVTERRTAVDFANVVRDLVDKDYADAEKIVLVMDNLNTHSPSSLYEAFEPAEARRILERLEIHYTPKHASWLDMAETELSVLGRQCLDRRISARDTLTREVTAWEKDRNSASVKVDWRFTTADARIKLKRLYPSIQPK